MENRLNSMLGIKTEIVKGKHEPRKPTVTITK